MSWARVRMGRTEVTRARARGWRGFMVSEYATVGGYERVSERVREAL